MQPHRATAIVRVLILEDDTELAMSWADHLEAFDYRCDIVSTCRDAELACRSQRYEAVIADMFLKDSNGAIAQDGGLTFITHLRLPFLADMPSWGERVPVISISGSDAIVDALSHATNAGADRTFNKPVNPDELLEALEDLVARQLPATLETDD